MVGERKIPSATEGPEDLQNRSQPRQRLVVRLIVACQPMSGASECLAQEGTSRVRRVQAVGPATEGGGIGKAIRVFERGRCLFPGAVLNETPLQDLTTRQQTVVRIRERKRREEGKGRSATGAATAPDLDPVVMLIVRLLAASSVTRDRVAFTNGAPPQNDVGALLGPIRLHLVRRDRKWDKKNRSSSGLRPGVDLPKIGAGSGAPPPDEKTPTGRE
jgi:hypothetical protein